MPNLSSAVPRTHRRSSSTLSISGARCSRSWGERTMQADASYEESFFLYGNILVDQDRSGEAIPYLRKAIQNRHDFVPARVVLARALVNLQKWPEAIAELNETVALDSTHPQPHLLL